MLYTFCMKKGAYIPSLNLPLLNNSYTVHIHVQSHNEDGPICKKTCHTRKLTVIGHNAHPDTISNYFIVPAPLFRKFLQG